MARIALYMLLQMAMLLGWGCLMRRLFIPGKAPGGFMLMWLGWAGLVCVLQLLHLLFPIQAWILYLALALGASGLWLGRKDLLGIWHNIETAPQGHHRLLGWLVLALVLVLLTGHLVIGLHENKLPFDTELYHLAIVRWNSEYPTVPGLACLHSRLGVNSGLLLYAALLDNGQGDARSAWLMGGLPVLLVLLQWMAVLLLDRGPGSAWRRCYCLLTLPYVLRLLSTLEASLYFDKAALLCALVSGLCVLHAGWTWLGEEPASSIGRRTRDTAAWSRDAATHLVPLLSVLMLGFSFKQSLAFHAALFGLPAIGACVLLLRQEGAGLMKLLRTMVYWGVLPGLLLLGYLANNAVLSGWLFFPAPILELPVPWALPKADTVQLFELIKSWARVQGRADLGNAEIWQWMNGWKKGFMRTTEYDLLLACVSLYVVLLWRAWTGALARAAGRTWWQLGLGLASLLNFAAWFHTAPDVRFADGLFWMGFAILATFTLGSVLDSARSMCAASLAISIALLAFAPWDFLPRETRFSFWDVPHARSLPTVPYPPRTETQDPAIPVVLVPQSPASDQVGNAPLPSTPYRSVAERLRYRKPGSLRHGFYLVDGPAVAPPKHVEASSAPTTPATEPGSDARTQ